MAKSKYESIYNDIRRKIETGEYAFGSFLPSENSFCEEYDCTRNTVRRALSVLQNEAYVLPQHGKGVQVIYEKISNQNIYTIGGIESFQETIKKSGRKISTKVVFFKEIICDKQMSERTGFDEGEALYYIERIRKVHGQRIIFDTNIFLKSETEGLTKKIAEHSIYDYLENTLQMNITTSRRRITAERMTSTDQALLDMEDFDFLLVVTGQVFNSKGIMFEYTQSRHRPDQVCFVESAIRQKLNG